MKHEWQNFYPVYKPVSLVIELRYSLVLTECLFFVAEQDETLEVCPFVENGSGSEKRFSGTIFSTISGQENQENNQLKNV